MEKLIWAFLIGGGICAVGQILMDALRMTPAHTMPTMYWYICRNYIWLYCFLNFQTKRLKKI